MGLLLSMAACDSAPGPAELNPRPPVLSDFSFSPGSVNPGQLPAGWQMGDDVVSGPVEVSVTARDPDGRVETVGVVVQSPNDPTQPLTTGNLQPTGDDRYAGTISLALPMGAVGTYTVLVFAVDDDQVQSGEVRGLLRLNAADAGEPPVIEEVVAPDTVRRPDAGELPVPIPIAAVVSDPDGLSNIASVQFWPASNPNVTIDLCDNGGGACGGSPESGDEQAGDGVFSQTIEIGSSNTPGTYTFVFQARDLTDLRSETVEIDIVVE